MNSMSGPGRQRVFSEERTSSCIDRPAATDQMGQANRSIGARGDPGHGDLRPRFAAPPRGKRPPGKYRGRVAESRSWIFVGVGEASGKSHRLWPAPAVSRTTRACSCAPPSFPGRDARTERRAALRRLADSRGSLRRLRRIATAGKAGSSGEAALDPCWAISLLLCSRGQLPDPTVPRILPAHRTTHAPLSILAHLSILT